MTEIMTNKSMDTNHQEGTEEDHHPHMLVTRRTIPQLMPGKEMKDLKEKQETEH